MKSNTPKIVTRCADLLISSRRVLLVIFLAVTAALIASSLRIKLDPGFYKMIPLEHPYMKTFLKYADVFPGGNRILVNLRWNGSGDIYNNEFLHALRGATDEVFFIPGVDRPRVTSLFTPNVRFIEVTEKGFYGDVVVPAKFSGQPEELATVRRNTARSGEIGRLVQNDLKGAMIRSDLQEIDPQTGKKVDYIAVAKKLEKIRREFTTKDLSVQISGFPTLIGDIVNGLMGVILFFGCAFVITGALLFAYCRSLKMTMLALTIAILPVTWLLGLLPLLGYGIDPLSILVPFLIFSIGVSHAVQMTNAWKQEVVRGLSPMWASHAAFTKLFIPGSVALLTNALGFMVIMRIDIPSVRELGVTACLGVLLMILTNKLLLPVLLSYMTLEASAHRAQRAADSDRHPLWWRLSAAAQRPVALAVFAAMLVLLVGGVSESRKLTIGDIGSGAPEFRENAQYNRDNAAIISSYHTGIDVLSVIAETRGYSDDACLKYPVMHAIDQFESQMRGVYGVRSVVSVPDLAKTAIAANNEGNPRWAALPRSSRGLSQGADGWNPDLGFNTDGCTAVQVLIYTKDHQGATIDHIVSEIKRFAEENNSENINFRLAAGNVGVIAATNEAVKAAEVTMLLSIFGAISLLCFVTFRSWRAVLCIIVPLIIVSILCNALMAMLGIGLKVATLPVIALGVGVGVDYGIYLFERVQHHMHYEGHSFHDAFYEAMCQRGTAAVFTAITMAFGVGTWAFSSLKFQSDMGILLAFMFLVNLLGAVLLLPALAVWLGVGEERKGRRASAEYAQVGESS
ncbi:efflux RND transporter permease subunit [Paraburkholderia sacchari]|uniref:efflux RND transporter permease subunit n=1 Tax=Paraburkholderia sacchari TaxID=159450 RepID=UPI00054340CC|nr:efflux RND transporter permease subunit [Paraburkholderia sacchari]NLP64903.1 MMPL family transporter [Paraburkholderia sacchari]